MPSKLAVQMFTVRDFTKTAQDLAASLRKVRDMGYTAVQFSAVGCMNGATPEVSAVQARKMLDDHGLRCVATHRGWGDLLAKTEAEIEFHQALGCGFTAIGGLPREYADAGAEGYRRFVKEAAQVLPRLKKAGIAFGYHNHAHEFVRSGEGRRTLYDIFIEEGGDLLCLEIDVYWAVHAGVNPERLFERCRGRVPVIHFKDKEVVVKDGPVMAPIGEGNLDWDHLIPSCEKAGVQWYCIEQDVCRRDPFDCLKSSFDYLTSKGL